MPYALRAFVVFAVCALISSLLWPLLKLPGQFWIAIVPAPNCSTYGVGTPAMYGCSSAVAVLSLVGPLVLTLALAVFRAPLGQRLRGTRERVPAEWRFLVAPAAATLAFGITWAGIHYDTGEHVGLLVQRDFPALAGLFVFLIASRRQLPVIDALVAWVTPWPPRARLAAAAAGAVLLAFLLTRNLSDANRSVREQAVVIGALALVAIALAPAPSRPSPRREAAAAGR